MKKMLIIALVFFAKSAFAQKDTIGVNIPFINNAVVFERVFNVPNIPKNLLYSNAEIWMAENHPYIVSTQMTMNDPAMGRVLGIANASVQQHDKVLWETQYYYDNFKFTVQIDCKDNAYRIRIYDIQDVSGTTYTPVDYMMQSLINGKSLTLDNGAVMKKNNLQTCLKGLTTVVNNVMAQISDHMTVDNSF